METETTDSTTNGRTSPGWWSLAQKTPPDSNSDCAPTRSKSCYSKQWAKRLRSGGLRRLRARKSTGRPSKLTPQQQRVLLRKLKRGARAAGFPTERWTLWRIGRLIEREFGVSYHPNYLNRLLDKLDWSIQVRQAGAAERDDKAVEAWLQHDWPRIKKGTSKPSNPRVFR